MTKSHIATLEGEQRHTVEKQGQNVRLRRSWAGETWDQKGLASVELVDDGFSDGLFDLDEDGWAGDRPKRGLIETFSESSRRRMARAMQALDFTRLEVNYAIVWGGLTYPNEYPEAKASKKDLEAMREQIRRKYGGRVFGFWKLEAQIRGAPHYHFLFMIPRGVCWGHWDSPEWTEDGEIKRVWSGEVCGFDSWLRKAWFDHVGSGDENHYDHGLWVEDVAKADRVASYVAKYIGKPQEAAVELSWREPGRFWGIIGRDVMTGYLTGEIYVVSRAVALLIRRTLRRFSITKAKAAGRRRAAIGKSGDWRKRSWRWRLQAGGKDTWNTWDPLAGDGRRVVALLLEKYGVIECVPMDGMFMR